MWEETNIMEKAMQKRIMKEENNIVDNLRERDVKILELEKQVANQKSENDFLIK